MKTSHFSVRYFMATSAALLSGLLASCTKDDTQVAAVNEFFTSQLSERDEQLRQKEAELGQLRSEVASLSERLKNLEKENETLKANPPLDPEALAATLAKSLKEVVEGAVKSEIAQQVPVPNPPPVDDSNRFVFPDSRSGRNGQPAPDQGGRVSNPNAQKFEFSFP